MNITELPFNRFVGIGHAQKEGSVLSLPDDIRYTNHLGTVHASALLALAEATSGDYLVRELSGVGFDVLPVVRHLEARFRKPAIGAVFSRLNVHPEEKEQFMAPLVSKGRALLRIPVDVHDEKGTHALAAVVEWFVARQD